MVIKQLPITQSQIIHKEESREMASPTNTYWPWLLVGGVGRLNTEKHKRRELS